MTLTFLNYHGDHSQLVPSTQPVATVTVPENFSPMEMLDFAHAQTQHLDGAWFDNAAVDLCVRSTSSGDLIHLPDGSPYVVERVGFQPYQSDEHKVEEACQLCESPVSWEMAKVGDQIGTEEVGLFRVIARKLRPKWRAKRLLTCIPDAQIWIDSRETWALLVPLN